MEHLQNITISEKFLFAIGNCCCCCCFAPYVAQEDESKQDSDSNNECPLIHYLDNTVQAIAILNLLRRDPAPSFVFLKQAIYTHRRFYCD